MFSVMSVIHKNPLPPTLNYIKRKLVSFYLTIYNVTFKHRTYIYIYLWDLEGGPGLEGRVGKGTGSRGSQ